MKNCIVVSCKCSEHVFLLLALLLIAYLAYSTNKLSIFCCSCKPNAKTLESSPGASELTPTHSASEAQGSIGPSKVSTGTAPLRTSEQIRLAVDSTLRLRTIKKNKTECSSLVEKLRWLTSLDDEEGSDGSQSGFATWPSRDKNGSIILPGNKKSDAGTSTNEEFVQSAVRQPPIHLANEAKIKQISYTLEDIDEGLKGSENELENFITEDSGRIERLRKRYTDEGGDDYGFSRRPSVKGIKPKFSSTNQIFAQFTAMRAAGGADTPVPVEAQYENARTVYEQLPGVPESVRVLNYELQSASPRPPPEESRAHFEMLRQSFEQASINSFNRPHSWSVSTLPHNNHPHVSYHNHSHSISMGPQPPTNNGAQGFSTHVLTNNLSGSSLSVTSQQPQQQPLNNLSMASAKLPPSSSNNSSINPSSSSGTSTPVVMSAAHHAHYGTLPPGATNNSSSNNGPTHAMIVAGAQQQQQLYGTVRRVPNVIGRPVYLHYGALSVEAHPKKIVQPFPPQAKVPETPSPTQQPPPIRYYGPPIRYYNPPPPVPPRSVTTSLGSGSSQSSGSSSSNVGSNLSECNQERGVPEGATDEEPSVKESYSMKV